MAAAAKQTLIDPNGDPNVELWKWTLTTADPTGDALCRPQHADITYQGDGGATWGGATLAIQASNLGVNFAAASNAATGNAATMTADGIQTITEDAMFHRPKLTTVGVAASVIVTAMVRKQPRNI